MARILFCGDGHGAISVAKGLLKSGYVCDVFSNDSEVTELFIKAGGKSSSGISNWIESKNDLVISAAYKPLIPKSDIDRAHIINVHYALFPKYRGLHSIVWAMLNGEKHIGLTIHYMDELLDSGPILFQEKMEIGEKTSWELMMAMDRRAGEVIGDVVGDLLKGRLKATPQDHSQATFVGRRNKTDCLVSWEKWNSVYFQRALKALVKPYPRPYFLYKEKEIEIVEAEIDQRNYVEIPGHIVYRDHNFVWIKLSDGLLKLKTVSIDGEEVRALDIFKRTGIRLG